jgi:hypothetical protein
MCVEYLSSTEMKGGQRSPPSPHLVKEMTRETRKDHKIDADRVLPTVSLTTEEEAVEDKPYRLRIEVAPESWCTITWHEFQH